MPLRCTTVPRVQAVRTSIRGGWGRGNCCDADEIPTVTRSCERFSKATTGGRSIPPAPGDPKDRQGFSHVRRYRRLFLLAPTVDFPFEAVQIGFRWLLIALAAASVLPVAKSLPLAASLTGNRADYCRPYRWVGFRWCRESSCSN